MESKSNKPPLVVIVGETASGKTALAIELARLFNGEVIAADSRTVYAHANIGTAKPTASQMDGIRHHLLDVVDPSQAFSAADFKRLANEAIADITSRGKLSIMAGGSGLYVDAVIYDYVFKPAPDPEVRAYLQRLSVPDLQAMLHSKGIALPRNSQNPRHLVRAIETEGEQATKSDLRRNTLLLGLQTDKTILRDRLVRRVDEMIGQGLETEASQLATAYGWDAPGLQATSYKALREYITGQISLDEAKALFVQNDWHLAKRQRTWFKRNKDINWICKKEEAVELITTFLNNTATDS